MTDRDPLPEPDDWVDVSDAVREVVALDGDGASIYRPPEPADEDWFDGVTPCPECGHTCYDHALCRRTDGVVLHVGPDQCLCDHRAHFTGEV